VSFYGLEGPDETGWTPDRVAVGYTLPADASVLLVAVENGTVRGVSHVETTGLEHGVTADGDTVPLDRPLDGTRRLRVVAYADANRNGQFDPGTDTRCRSDGNPVQAGPRRVDFDAFQSTPTPAPTVS
jgi:hypothetical protein